MSTKTYEVFQFMGNTWAWNEANEVFLKQGMNWTYQFNFECDDPEAIVLLKAYIRSKNYGN